MQHVDAHCINFGEAHSQLWGLVGCFAGLPPGHAELRVAGGSPKSSAG